MTFSEVLLRVVLANFYMFTKEYHQSKRHNWLWTLVLKNQKFTNSLSHIISGSKDHDFRKRHDDMYGVVLTLLLIKKRTNSAVLRKSV